MSDTPPTSFPLGRAKRDIKAGEAFEVSLLPSSDVELTPAAADWLFGPTASATTKTGTLGELLYQDAGSTGATGYAAEVPKENQGTAKIYGLESAEHFTHECPVLHVSYVCWDIWKHPSKYSDYQDNTEGAYYGFLKYLWVHFPDGTEKKLSDIATEQEETSG